jgi:hypothetical protein
MPYNMASRGAVMVRRILYALASALLLAAGIFAVTGGIAAADVNGCLSSPTTGTALTCPDGPNNGPATVPGVGMAGSGEIPGGPTIDEMKRAAAIAGCAFTAAQAAASSVSPICVEIPSLDGPIGGCIDVPPPVIRANACNVPSGY